MKLPDTRSLHAYWSSLRRGRCAPDRDDLDLPSMRRMLAHTMVVDIDATQGGAWRLPIRLSGTRLDAMFNRDLRGADLADLWGPNDQDLVRDIATEVVEGVSPAVVGGFAAPPAAPRLGVELLLLPLRHQGKGPGRLLGGLALSSMPGWLGLQASQPLEVTSWRMLDVGEGEQEAGRVPADLRPRLVVHQGGRSVDAAETAWWKARVKPILSRSGSHP